MATKQSAVSYTYNSRGAVTGFQIEIAHAELNKHRLIKAADQNVLLRKAELQLKEWAEQWQLKAAKQHIQKSREQERRERDEKKREAEERTAEAQEIYEGLTQILQKTLNHHDAIDWDSLKDSREFPEARPKKPAPLPKPTPKADPTAPDPTSSYFTPKIGFIDHLIPSRKANKLASAAAAYEEAREQWKRDLEKIKQENTRALATHDEATRRLEEKHQQDVEAWKALKAEFLQQQEVRNAAIEGSKQQYLASQPEAIVGYCDMVLANSEYHECFPKEWELDYNSETKILVINYSLLAPDALPTLTEIRYSPGKDEFTEKHLTDSQGAKLYDDVVYQVILRTVHELFEADTVSALDAISINGYVNSIDRATGKEVNSCVLSLQAKRDEFLNINLAAVEPKICFKQLKGVGSSKLHSVTPVAPILALRREDGRFVAEYAVADGLDEGYNLASMDWEDFEHLIREVFAKEFSGAGGEVKVTRASHDGGVDAVAFDPDPIRGGKIVIQAKRYTATVGVSAVRDLYGTVMNEGANKGILITTSDYGPDAYSFAAGKPIHLMNGANLLHLLEKHGHKATIDLQKARQDALRRN